MKFYRAETTCPIEMELIVSSKPKFRVFPEGTEVSATPAGNGVPGAWHLNARDAKGAWSGYTQERNLIIGEVIATANE